ncbi:hypothetical protein NHX12_010329 [Muraenolepis orangiensis]|uniref:Collagenase 3 n=1 Tax=Muraenolepis orangiensis TaxID=630683 RepID=A0A9Q0DJD4_9TELE|nr:hypothetical protein NHX12_010329 [Muraenolepis orangiensis]
MAPSADRQGYWGRPTSTLDWCEENYVVSYYIAEFWNTVSNLIMILPPLYGALQTYRDGLEFRYTCSFLGLAAVGVGSWCFHMTLLYEMQHLDTQSQSLVYQQAETQTDAVLAGTGLAEMGTLWLGLLVLLVPSELHGFPLRSPGTPPVPPAPSEDEVLFAKSFLERFYGYLSSGSDRQRREAHATNDSTALCAAVKQMQRGFGLPADGRLTADTLALMRRPRCGLSDAEPFRRTWRWKRSTVSYRISSYGPTVGGASEVRKSFRAAWRMWAEVTPIRVRRRSRRDADVVISFHRGDHEDGSPFDGRGGGLAHAFLPGRGLGGDVHFDQDEDWSFNATGINLFAVAVHEFGHALGLPHSWDPGAVMYPTYSFLPDLRLSEQDVKEVQHMYGTNPMFASLFSERPPPRTPDKCDSNLSFDAVTELQQEIVFFKDRFMWRKYPASDEIGISLIGGLWPDVPHNMDAAYENVEMNQLMFFKGTGLVVQLKLMEGFPRSISELGFSPRVEAVDASLHFRSARLTIFFTGNECWRYDERRKTMEEGSPAPIHKEWPGVPSHLDAAVFYKGFVYFFKGGFQYKYDPEVRYLVSRRSAIHMLGCRADSGKDMRLKETRA